MSDEPKACPFCGGKEIRVMTDTFRYHLHCETCDIQGPKHTDREGAKELGNTPTPKQLEHSTKRGTCQKYEQQNAEDIAKDAEETRILLEHARVIDEIAKRLKAQHRISWTGVEKCPVCGSNLHMHLNVFNRHGDTQKHLHGRCETKECLNWRE